MGGVIDLPATFASLWEINVAAATMIDPPRITKKSTGSPKARMPSKDAQTNCRNVTGCVTEMGAAASAFVMAK